MKQIIITLAFFICFSHLTNGQQIFVGKKIEIQFTSIDNLKNDIYIFFKDYYKIIDLVTFEIDSVKINLDDGFIYSNYIPILINSKQFFVHNEGGLVFCLVNDTIKRIDNSFNHKMQVRSNIFPYNSKIYRFGGYGFWSARNFFTYFDDDIFEWEAVSQINSKSIPEGTFDTFHVLSNDNVYFFNGKSINPYNRIKNYFNDKVWKYNFTTKEWSYLGKSLLLDYDIYLKPIQYRNSILYVKGSEIIVIDVMNNNKIIYARNKYSYNITSNVNSYFLNNKFYLFNEKNDDITLNIVNEKDFFGKKISEEPFYNNYTLLINTIVILFSLVLLSVIIIVIKRTIKKRRKIVLLENGLRFKNKFSEFDDKSMQIIRMLLSNDEINSNTILGVVEEKQYSIAHNERLKVQKLEEINFKIKTLLGININIIQSKKSDKDRRIRTYSINKELFFTKL